MKIRIKTKYGKKPKTVVMEGVKFYTFDKNYLGVTFKRVGDNEQVMHRYFKLTSVLEVEEL